MTGPTQAVPIMLPGMWGVNGQQSGAFLNGGGNSSGTARSNGLPGKSQMFPLNNGAGYGNVIINNYFGGQPGVAGQTQMDTLQQPGMLPGGIFGFNPASMVQTGGQPLIGMPGLNMPVQPQMGLWQPQQPSMYFGGMPGLNGGGFQQQPSIFPGGMPNGYPASNASDQISQMMMQCMGMMMTMMMSLLQNLKAQPPAASTTPITPAPVTPTQPDIIAQGKVPTADTNNNTSIQNVMKQLAGTGTAGNLLASWLKASVDSPQAQKLQAQLIAQMKKDGKSDNQQKAIALLYNVFQHNPMISDLTAKQKKLKKGSNEYTQMGKRIEALTKSKISMVNQYKALLPK